VAEQYRVKGILFLDYVRMLRSYKSVDWRELLPADDLIYLHRRIHPGSWYPMGTFERMGNQIFHHVARGDLQLVRAWGRVSVDQLRAAQPTLVAAGDPMETVNRFRVLRSVYFDFDALHVLMLHEGEALVGISYYMGMPAEEAASWQTLGFFERLLELSGAIDVEARFTERSWAGDPRTVLALAWRMPRRELGDPEDAKPG
jgi:eukaryotic-like serine/threonine-protein kinase